MRGLLWRTNGRLATARMAVGVPAAIRALVLCPLNNYTFAAMDFLLRRGASDEHTLQRSVRNEQRRLSEKDMPPGGWRRFWVLDFVAPRSHPAAGMLPRRASPEPKIDATNV